MAFSNRITLNAWGDVEVEGTDQLGGCWYPIATRHGRGGADLRGLSSAQAQCRVVTDLSFNPVLGPEWGPACEGREQIEKAVRVLTLAVPEPDAFDDEGRPM